MDADTPGIGFVLLDNSRMAHSTISKNRVASFSRIFPYSVRWVPLLPLINSGTSSLDSSVATAWVTADCERCCFAEAREMLSSRATAAKVLSWHKLGRKWPRIVRLPG
jgi:hypothetical protein